MITLTTVSFIWLIISIYRFHKKTGSWFDWDPFDGTVFDTGGILIGGSVSIIFTLWMCIKFLP